MFEWEDKTALDSYRAIADEIEEVGRPARHFMPGHKTMKNVWTQSFKAWEYPFVFLWLEKLAKNLKLDRKLKVMDFGCGRCAFPEFLARKGFEVWGVDNDANNFIKPIRKEIDKHYPHVTYWLGDVLDFNKAKFDAIISCSVIEHILPSSTRLGAVQKLRDLLEPHGKMLHIADYYFPEMKTRKKNQIDFLELCTRFGFSVGDQKMCPGSPEFDFDIVRKRANLIIPSNRKTEARVAVGDDV